MTKEGVSSAAAPAFFVLIGKLSNQNTWESPSHTQGSGGQKGRIPGRYHARVLPGKL